MQLHPKDRLALRSYQNLLLQEKVLLLQEIEVLSRLTVPLHHPGVKEATIESLNRRVAVIDQKVQLIDAQIES